MTSSQRAWCQKVNRPYRSAADPVTAPHWTRTNTHTQAWMRLCSHGRCRFTTRFQGGKSLSQRPKPSHSLKPLTRSATLRKTLTALRMPSRVKRNKKISHCLSSLQTNTTLKNADGFGAAQSGIISKPRYLANTGDTCSILSGCQTTSDHSSASVRLSEALGCWNRCA